MIGAWDATMFQYVGALTQGAGQACFTTTPGAIAAPVASAAPIHGQMVGVLGQDARAGEDRIVAEANSRERG